MNKPPTIFSPGSNNNKTSSSNNSNNKENNNVSFKPVDLDSLLGFNYDTVLNSTGQTVTNTTNNKQKTIITNNYHNIQPPAIQQSQIPSREVSSPITTSTANTITSLELKYEQLLVRFEKSELNQLKTQNEITFLKSELNSIKNNNNSSNNNNNSIQYNIAKDTLLPVIKDDDYTDFKQQIKQLQQRQLLHENEKLQMQQTIKQISNRYDNLADSYKNLELNFKQQSNNSNENIDNNIQVTKSSSSSPSPSALSPSSSPSPIPLATDPILKENNNNNNNKVKETFNKYISPPCPIDLDELFKNVDLDKLALRKENEEKEREKNRKNNNNNNNNIQNATTTTISTTISKKQEKIEKRMIKMKDEDKGYLKIKLEELSNQVPDKIQFYIYNIIFSNPHDTITFSHMDKQFTFSSKFLIYSYKPLTSLPVIHVSNVDGDHFGVSIVNIINGNDDQQTTTLQQSINKEEFQKLLTFHNVFFSKVLKQEYLKFNDYKDKYFIVPDITCISNDQQDTNSTFYDDLLHLFKFQFLKENGMENKELFYQLFNEKLVLTDYGEYLNCCDIIFPENNSSDNGDGDGIDIESTTTITTPILKCLHSKGKKEIEHWVSKSIIFYDEQGKVEDPNQWCTFKTEPTNLSSYQRNSKKIQKSPMDVAAIGIPILIQMWSKFAILPLISELRYTLKLYQFIDSSKYLNYLQLNKSGKILRDVLTHPSTKVVIERKPNEKEMFKNYQPYMGNYQRIEFIGDSLLKVVASIYLYKRFPFENQGILSLKRSELTENKYLSIVSKEIGFEEIVRIFSIGDHIKPHADVVEALIGAVYIERGFAHCYNWIVKWVFKDENFKIDNHLLDFIFSNNGSGNGDEDIIITGNDENFEFTQRKEFLGDSVLDFIVAEYLYLKYPDQQEGFLTRNKQLLVENANLTRICKSFDQLSSNVQNQESNGKKIFADYLESYIGSHYLQQGGNSVCKFVYSILNLDNFIPTFYK